MYKDRIRQLERQFEGVDLQIEAILKSDIFEDQHLKDLRNQRESIREELSTLRKQQYDHDNEYNVGHDDE